MRRNQLAWGIILLLFGVLMLANQMGVRLPNGMSLTDLFWPLVLILGGIWVLFGVFVRGNVEAENASIELQNATSASLNISHGAGDLKIHSGATAGEIVHGSFSGGLDRQVNRNGDKLEVRLRPARDVFDFPFFGPRQKLDWDVAMNSQIPIALKLNLGANSSNLDLRDLNITNVDLDTGASDTRLLLPARGRFKVDLDMGAASLEMTIPDGLSARVRASLGAAELKIDQVRFPRNGSYYQSPDFEIFENAADIKIDAGVASIMIK